MARPVTPFVANYTHSLHNPLVKCKIHSSSIFSYEALLSETISQEEATPITTIKGSLLSPQLYPPKLYLFPFILQPLSRVGPGPCIVVIVQHPSQPPKPSNTAAGR